MTKQPPTQELVAKDLHGNDWRFRHIFRGIYYYALTITLLKVTAIVYLSFSIQSTMTSKT